MFQRTIGTLVVVCVCLFSLALAAQQPQAAQQSSAVVAEPEAPRVVLQAESTASVLRLMKFSGALRDQAGNARTGAVGLTFALYKDQQGGSPLWLEVHNAQLDEQGRYTVLLGSTKSEGLPLELFSSGEARWLGVQLNLPGEEEQPRVLLVSVPYALKAADAETLGGKPPSAFLLAEKAEGREAAGKPEAGKEAAKEGPPREGVFGPISGDGTADFLAKFTSANTIANSGIVELSGSGKVGIGTTTPNVKLSLGTDITAQKLALYDGLGDFYGFGVQPGRVVLHTANTERMAITSDGRVGIGTAAPGARLAVTGAGTGDARFGDPGCGGNYTGIWLNQLTANCTNYNLTSSPGDQTLYVNRPAGASIEFREGNAPEMVVKAGGKVGIGTTAPNVKLSLGTDITAQKLALYDGLGDFYGFGVQAGRIVLHTANTERMAITSAGNVGIGTTIPSTKLHAVGTTTLQTDAAANKALVVKAAASQSTNIQEWQDSGGAFLASLTKAGTFQGPLGMILYHPSFQGVVQTSSGSAGFSGTDGSARLFTGATAGSSVKVNGGFIAELFGIGSFLNAYVGWEAGSTVTANHKFYVLAGGPNGPNTEGFGFKAVGSALKGVTILNSVETEVDLTTTLCGGCIFRLVAIRRAGPDRVEFYVQGTLKGSSTTNLPSVASYAYELRVENGASASSAVLLVGAMTVGAPAF